MAIDYQALYKKHTSREVLAYQTKATKRVYAKLRPWLERYKGGLPVGVFAAFAQYESNGRMDAPGDNYLGEVGYFQITKTLPKHFGLSPELRKNPEGNVFLAGLEYNDEAARFALLYPAIQPGTADSWKIARLVFAVGRNGTRLLLNAAKPLVPGNAYGSVVSYVERTGGIDLGRAQPKAKVWFRVKMIAVQWAIGMKAIGGKVGRPEILPTPPGVPGYRLSPKVKAVMVPLAKKPVAPSSAGIASTLGIGAALAVIIALTKGK